MIQVFGIRHHGPGSANSLIKALSNWGPDIVLIEGPPDANKMIQYVENQELMPPVAIMVYNPKNLNQAAYYPFASFSPEWQAMKFGLENKLPVRFIDLPKSLEFSIKEKEEDEPQLIIEIAKKASPIEQEKEWITKDPMAYMAELAGYADHERWWEVTFEAAESSEEIFPAIVEMIDELRSNLNRPTPDSELRREAYMRNCIRLAQKEGFEKIAVVCGAWHSSVLQHLDQFKVGADKAVLKGIKATKTASTWVPWTFERLSFQSGYGAGVISPAWYQLIFSQRKDIVIQWMTKVAHLLREEDWDASSAHVIEAVRLAETLAVLRNLRLPGIDELMEAAVTIFCSGDSTRLELIQKKLVIGDVIGKVPESIPVVPLQKDLEQCIKTARMSKYWNTTEELYLKATQAKPRGGIDLREEKDRLKSFLLHRLNLLDIDWGEQKKGRGFDTGSFKEYWKLSWKPDFAIQIIEAGMWGNTVLSAAANYLAKKVETIDSLPLLTDFIDIALKADLTSVIPTLIKKLQDVSSVTKEVAHLLDALPSLVEAAKYGTAREMDVSSLNAIIDQLIPRMCIALPNACVGVNDEASKLLFSQINKANASINIFNKKEHYEPWHNALKYISNMPNVNGVLKGVSSRILFDKNIIEVKEAARQMGFALSQGSEAAEAANWVEGFLHGSAQILIYNQELWNILDAWVDELNMEIFKELLPLLRRTFSNFSHPERQKMLRLARKGHTQSTKEETANSIDSKRSKKVLPILKLLLD